MSSSVAERLPDYAHYADVPPSCDADKPAAELNALTPEQIALAAGSEEAAEEFKKASRSAAQAVQEIETMFSSLTAKLNNIGDVNELLVAFFLIQNNFREVVKKSHGMAIDIAQYAETFDEVVIKFCADEKLSVEERKVKITEFIKKSESIQGEAKEMDQPFASLKNEFAAFVGSFEMWARQREWEDEEMIKELYQHIKELDERAAVALLLVQYNKLNEEKKDDENKIKELEDQVSKIKATRAQLEKEGLAALATFTMNIGVMGGVWAGGLKDATEIQAWLKCGADNANYPNYMKLYLQQGARIYSRMSQYLKDYANGVTETIESFSA